MNTTFFIWLRGRFSRQFEPELYLGYAIMFVPNKKGELYQLRARVIWQGDGKSQTHELVRADYFPSLKEARNASIEKARHLIDKEGEGLFNQM